MSELRKCSRCQSTKLEQYFGVNVKGEFYKTCDNCRTKGRERRARYEQKRFHIPSSERLKECACGGFYNNKTKHTETKRHKAYLECKLEKPKCFCNRCMEDGECDRCIRSKILDKHYDWLKQDDRESERPLTESEKHKRDTEYVPCVCGGGYLRPNRAFHFNTYRHLRYVEEIEDEFTDEDEGVLMHRKFIKPGGGLTYRLCRSKLDFKT
jgi:hypothetical protein